MEQKPDDVTTHHRLLDTSRNLFCWKFVHLCAKTM